MKSDKGKRHIVIVQIAQLRYPVSIFWRGYIIEFKTGIVYVCLSSPKLHDIVFQIP